MNEASTRAMQEVPSHPRWPPTPSKIRRNSILSENGIKSSKGRGSVTLPSLGPALSELQSLATECGVELPTVWQTALAITLHTYNPSEAVSFACEHDHYLVGQSSETHSSVYICSLRIEPTETALDLLRRFHASKKLDQDRSFDHSIAWVQMRDGGSSMHSCQVAIRCHSRVGKRCFSDIDQSLDALFNITSMRGSRLVGCLEYSASAVSDGLAWSMLQTVDSVLRVMNTSLRTPLEDLNVCSIYDLEIVRKFTASVAQAEEKCIHGLILDQCRATPDAIAITSPWEDSNMTYSELDQLTSLLAHQLVAHGVGPEVFVLCCFEKSLWAIIARLAILRAGGAYIMVCARNPPTYLHSIVNRAKVQIMLTAPKFTTNPLFQELVPTIIEVSRESLRVLPHPSSPLVVDVKSHNACLILFTSGSTGTPKGIVQTHRSYATAIREYARVLKLGPKTRVFQFDDYAFDISNNDYLAPLMTGGCCCVPRPWTPENPPTIPRLLCEINDLQATATFLTPTVAIQIDPEQVGSLDLICIGGEAMAKDVLKKWSGKARLVNQYGMGEVATFCAYNTTPSEEKPSAVGRPGCNTIWLVSLASPERLVPVGAVGEVLIEGPNIARGYLDEQVRTSGARFLEKVPSWMAELHPERTASPMYLSGDLARYSHDGTIDYVGRKDLLLKVDGTRVDAIEIEHCARKGLHPNDAIIVGLLGTISETMAPPILTGYLYLHDHPSVNVNAGAGTVFRPSTSCVKASEKVAKVVAVLQETLPMHMIPMNFLLVNQIPRTASKKTDRKKLNVQAEEYWKQESTPIRRFYLITHPRTASNLLIRILALKNQPNVMEHNISGYFFLRAIGLDDELGLKEKMLQDWSEDERSQMQQAYQRCFDDIEQYAEAAGNEGKIAFVKEHAQFMMEPVSRYQYLLGKGSIKEEPWTVRVPAKYGPDTTRSPLNETLLPEKFLKTWLPTFLIRHPAMTFPSQYRANNDLEILSGHSEGGVLVPNQLTFHWSRTLYDLYSEQLIPDKVGHDSERIWPVVLDADDIMTKPEVIIKYCKLVGLDTTKLAFTWKPSTEEEIAKLPDAQFRRMMSTLTASTGIMKEKLSGDISIDEEAKKWKEEFGQAEGEELERLVKAAMPDYEYLKAKRLRAGEA